MDLIRAKVAGEASHVCSARVPMTLARIVVADVTVSPESFLLTRIGRLDVASRLLSSSEMHVSSGRLNSRRGQPQRTVDLSR